jgi:radical SAM superfamily enzyme YgiQ (UPF0313 family)
LRVLFVIPSAFVSEPLGVLQLMAVVRKAGHQAGLEIVGRGDPARRVERWPPDVIAYSAMSSSADAISREDARLRATLRARGRSAFRIMGGPHATFCPGVLDEMALDAICQGDGDRALPELLGRLESGAALEGIANIGLSISGAPVRELVEDLDALPFPDRGDYYRAVPVYRDMGVRSFSTSRGCPYKCTYCFNHAYNRMFKDCGKLIRRRSVGNVITEIQKVMAEHPPVRFIRFADDTFAHRADAWLEEFAKSYSREVKVPFYCLMRSNTMNDDTAGLLAKAGCRSVGMSLEAGSEEVRNAILGRNLSDRDVKRSFAAARRHGLRTYTNTMLGVPGTTPADDMMSLEYTRRIRPAAATFTICCPYPGTRIHEFARERGLLDDGSEPAGSYADLSVLNCYTQREKEQQARTCYLGPLYCFVPAFLLPLVRLVMKSRLSLRLCNLLGSLYTQYRMATRIAPWALPRNPLALVRFVRSWLGFFSPRKRPGGERPGPRVLAFRRE